LNGASASVRARQSGNACHARSRARPLHRQHGEVAPRRDAHVRSDARAQRLEPGEILVGGTGVDHDAITPGTQAVDDEIVDHTPGVIEHAAVERSSRRLQLVHVVGERMAQELARPRPLDVEAEHVRDVEEPRVATHDAMLVEL
jgi:hypothetical protein